jgi:hypothetical protein
MIRALRTSTLLSILTTTLSIIVLSTCSELSGTAKASDDSEFAHQEAVNRLLELLSTLLSQMLLPAVNIRMSLFGAVDTAARTGDGDDVEERALGDRCLACEEIYEESEPKWEPMAQNTRVLRIGETVLIVDSDTIVPEARALSLRVTRRDRDACVAAGLLPRRGARARDYPARFRCVCCACMLIGLLTLLRERDRAFHVADQPVHLGGMHEWRRCAVRRAQRVPGMVRTAGCRVPGRGRRRAVQDLVQVKRQLQVCLLSMLRVCA